MEVRHLSRDVIQLVYIMKEIEDKTDNHIQVFMKVNPNDYNGIINSEYYLELKKNNWKPYISTGEGMSIKRISIKNKESLRQNAFKKHKGYKNN